MGVGQARTCVLCLQVWLQLQTLPFWETQQWAPAGLAPGFRPGEKMVFKLSQKASATLKSQPRPQKTRGVRRTHLLSQQSL